MLILRPRVVSFGTALWEGVASVVVDREASRLVVEHDDAGPHALFADAPEQVTRVKLVQELGQEELGSPRPGQVETLAFSTAPGASDARCTRVVALCCVESVTHEVSIKRGTVRTITLIALSPDGVIDPITLEPTE
jgi:hypothetical protein